MDGYGGIMERKGFLVLKSILVGVLHLNISKCFVCFGPSVRPSFPSVRQENAYEVMSYRGEETKINKKTLESRIVRL